MIFNESKEMQIIIRDIMSVTHEQPSGMMFGQIKRMKNENLTNHQIRVGLELMIDQGKFNKRSGLKRVPEYIGEAIKNEREIDQAKRVIEVTENKVLTIPYKSEFKYRNKKLKELN